MKNIKRILAFILILVLSASLLSVAYAKSDKQGTAQDEDEKVLNVLSEDIQTLKTLGLLFGADKNGLTYEYTHAKPTRVQAFIIYLRLMNQEADLNLYTYHHGVDKNFDDHDGHSAYVQKSMAYAKAHPEYNWIGSNGRFNPMAHLTAREYAKVMLTALGYEANVDFSWQTVERFAESIGLNVPEGAFTFEQFATMTVQTLNLEMKGTGLTLMAYLASINTEFAAKVALLGMSTTPDTLRPTVTDAVLSAPYTAGPPVVNGRVTIYFSEAMNADTLKNLENYFVDVDGAAAVSTSTQLSLLAESAAAPAADKKSVTLTIPGSTLGGGTTAGAGVTDIIISGLKDVVGNTIDPVTQFVRQSSVLTALSSAAVDTNKLQVTFDNPMKTIDTTEFKLYGADGVTLAAVGTSYAIDATGKIVTVTLGGSLTATAKSFESDLTTAKLAIGTAITRDVFGNAVTGAAAVPIVSVTTPATVTIADKIAPSVASLNKGTAAYTVEMTFTEPVNAIDQATLTAALKIRNLSGISQNATYTFSGSGGTINDFVKLTATIVGGTDNKYSIELLGQGIMDVANGNIVKAFAKTTVTVLTSDAQ